LNNPPLFFASIYVLSPPPTHTHIKKKSSHSTMARCSLWKSIKSSSTSLLYFFLSFSVLFYLRLFIDQSRSSSVY
jgi:hypothetical protein